MLDSINERSSENQIGFFGGSFTAIEKDRMEGLLETAKEYIDAGVAGSIRISTRPDCINESVLETLKKYRVTNIEIGVQSTDDNVLLKSGRGHTSGDSFAAAKLITEKGFVFGGQMMIGLPGATAESEVQTARDIVKMGAGEARIYPTVVFENTKLCEMTVKGEYKPLELYDAVERTAKCYRIFIENGVKVLRVGLHSSENLKNAPFGANHPAIGELVKSCVYTDIIAERAGDCFGKILEVSVRKNDISMLCGHNGAAIKRLKDKTGCADAVIIPSDNDRFEPSVKIRSV